MEHLCKRKEWLRSMPIDIKTVNYADKLVELVDDMQTKQLVIGMPEKNNRLQMIAIVQEQGRHIEAKNYPYLVIPTKNAAGRKTSEIAGLYQRGHALGIDDPSQPNGFMIMFVLRKSIDIPPRPFIRVTFNHHKDEWGALFAQALFQTAVKGGSINDIFKIVGDKAVKDMQNTLDKMSQPANAPLTTERKGFNNPLIDTKLMRDSITWFIATKK